MAGVLQRLARVCRRYNANPVHILCTATVGNPGQLGQLLLGQGAPVPPGTDLLAHVLSHVCGPPSVWMLSG